MRQLAAETVATADESMQSSIPKWGSMLRQQQEQLRSDTLSTLQSMSEQVQTSYREVLEASVTRTRETLREDAVLDEETRTQLRDSVVPLVHEVMEETGQKASEEFATAVQDGIDRVSVPLVQGAGLLIVVALVTMAIPSLLLFVSYHRSVAALNALRELERARGSSASPAEDTEPSG